MDLPQLPAPIYTAVTMPTHLSAGADLERVLLTAEDFLEWLDTEHTADLIDGEIFMHSPVSIRHAELLNFLDRLLGTYVHEHRLGRLFQEEVAVRLSSRNVFQPDLAFYRAGREDRIHDNHVEGAPDLVVEALSPRTADRDVGVKFAEYEQHGVTEYWVLDPETLAHRFYRRDGELLVEYAVGAARIESRVVPGFFVLREWLDPEHTPSILESIARIEAAEALSRRLDLWRKWPRMSLPCRKRSGRSVCRPPKGTGTGFQPRAISALTGCAALRRRGAGSRAPSRTDACCCPGLPARPHRACP